MPSLSSLSFPSSTPGRVLLVAGLGHFLFILWLGLTRHWGYLTNANDLGVYDQAVWGILHGVPFLNTATDFEQPISRLAIHFDPILAIFAPLYAIAPAAEWLILAQAVAISITAWPLYLLGIRLMQSERAAMLWSLAYLFNPFVISAAAWDFQTVSLAAPLMVLAMLAIESNRARLFLATCFMLLLIREHYGIAVAGFGFLWWLRQRTLLPALVALGIGIAGFVLVLGVIMPALSPSGSHVMMSQEMGHLSRYGWLGQSLSEVMKTLFFHPLDALRSVFLEMGGGVYLVLLFLPLLFTPVVGAEFLLPGAADLAVNLLSANPMPRSVFAYHSISLAPLLVIAGMQGALRMARWGRYGVVGLGGGVLWVSLFISYLVAPLSFAGAANIWKPKEYRLWPEPAIAEIRKHLPAEVSVSAQANVAPHVSQRFNLKAFPRGVGEADCVVLHLAAPTERVDGDDPGEVGSLAHHLQMPPAGYLAAVQSLVESGSYGISFWDEPWLVMCKGLALPVETERNLLRYMSGLEAVWLNEVGMSEKGAILEP